MSTTLNSKVLVARALLGLLVSVGLHAAPATAAEPSAYRVDFVSSPATGRAMNEGGTVVGVRATLTSGCTPSACAPVHQAVVWSGDAVIQLPLLPGFSTVTAVSINASGWIAGYAGDPATTGSRAVVWKPAGQGYAIVDLGVLPDTTRSWAAGIDDLGRVVGWSTDDPTFPKHSAPFVWTETGGTVDLTTQGFPNDVPLAVSPGGTVATSGFWYILGHPGSVTPLAPPPPGFSGPGTYPAAINDAGDQVRFQISTGTGRLPYLFRYHRAGIWQQIWSGPAGHLAPFGVGSINAAGDITATVNGIGLVAYAPNGLGEPLSAKLSPAYGAAGTTTVLNGGPITASGKILAQVIIGQSPRLARLVPAEACTTGCIRVASISMAGKFIDDPRNPGHCTPNAFGLVGVRLTVTDGAGRVLPGALVAGRVLDDYYLNKSASATTNSNGVVAFTYRAPACVGAIAVLVDDVTAAGRVLDFTTGTLTNHVTPVP